MVGLWVWIIKGELGLGKEGFRVNRRVERGVGSPYFGSQDVWNGETPRSLSRI